MAPVIAASSVISTASVFAFVAYQMSIMRQIQAQHGNKRRYMDLEKHKVTGRQIAESRIKQSDLAATKRDHHIIAVLAHI